MLRNEEIAFKGSLYWLGAFIIFFVIVLALPAHPNLKGIASYLPLHIAMETLSIVIAALIFAVGWNKPVREDYQNIIVLSCGFLGIALLDFAHTLSFAGMPDFVTPSSPEKAINFWLAARSISALILLSVAIVPWDKTITALHSRLVLIATLVIVVIFYDLLLVHQHLLPDTFISGHGLTPVKIVFEYGLIVVYLTTAFLFFRSSYRKTLEISSLIGAVLIMAMSEFLFTLYSDVTDVYNLTGHIFKLGAYILLYRALVYDTTMEPYQRLSESEVQLNQYAKELESSLESTLQVLSKMAELRDSFTAGHQKRVGAIAGDIAKEMGWSDADCKRLALIGLVHDIGKVGIPSEILNKPSSLTELERQMVQMHAKAGADILKDVVYLENVSKIVGQHHERIDGSGYPNHLSGNQITPEAKIIAVADVLESMVSNRPYRPALPIDTALNELKSGKGKLYDSAVVDALLRMIELKNYQIPASS